MAARLPSILMGSLTVVGVVHMAHRFYRRSETAWYAAGFLLTAFGFWVVSRATITDATLLFFTWVTMYGAYRGLTEDTRKWIMVAYAGAGLACLTKGPVGLVLPGLILLAWLAVTPAVRKWYRLFDPVGIIVFALVAVPWYAAMYVYHGADFVLEFLGLHNILRATVAEHPKDNVWYYYLLMMPIYVLPWIPLTLLGMVRAWKRRTVSDRFCLAWIGGTFLFYSLMATKYTTYCYIAIIPMILLTAVYWSERWEQKDGNGNRWLIGSVGSMLVLWIVASFLIQEGNWWYVYAAIAVAICILVQGCTHATLAGMTARSFLALTLVNWSVIGYVLEPVMETKSTHEVAPMMASLPTPQYTYFTYITSYPFYGGKIPILFEHKPEVNEVWNKKYAMPRTTGEEVLGQLQAGKNITIYVPNHAIKRFADSPYVAYVQLVASYPAGNIYITAAAK